MLVIQADRRDLPADLGSLKRMRLKDLVERYRDTVSVNKRRYKIERYVLNQFLRHSICSKSLSELRTADFAGPDTLSRGTPSPLVPHAPTPRPIELNPCLSSARPESITTRSRLANAWGFQENFRK
jgi:hypothetical protein